MFSSDFDNLRFANCPGSAQHRSRRKKQSVLERSFARLIQLEASWPGFKLQKKYRFSVEVVEVAYRVWGWLKGGADDWVSSSREMSETGNLTQKKKNKKLEETTSNSVYCCESDGDGDDDEEEFVAPRMHFVDVTPRRKGEKSFADWRNYFRCFWKLHGSCWWFTLSSLAVIYPESVHRF